MKHFYQQIVGQVQKVIVRLWPFSGVQPLGLAGDPRPVLQLLGRPVGGVLPRRQAEVQAQDDLLAGDLSSSSFLEPIS